MGKGAANDDEGEPRAAWVSGSGQAHPRARPLSASARHGSRALAGDVARRPARRARARPQPLCVRPGRRATLRHSLALDQDQTSSTLPSVRRRSRPASQPAWRAQSAPFPAVPPEGLRSHSSDTRLDTISGSPAHSAVDGAPARAPAQPRAGARRTAAALRRGRVWLHCGPGEQAACAAAPPLLLRPRRSRAAAAAAARRGGRGDGRFGGADRARCACAHSPAASKAAGACGWPAAALLTPPPARPAQAPASPWTRGRSPRRCWRRCAARRTRRRPGRPPPRSPPGRRCFPSVSASGVRPGPSARRARRVLTASPQGRGRWRASSGRVAAATPTRVSAVPADTCPRPAPPSRPFPGLRSPPRACPATSGAAGVARRTARRGAP